MKTKIGIIGGGNMGGAIIAGISGKYNVAVCEQDKKRCQWLKRKYKIAVSDLKAVVERSDVIILAVKPQGLDGVLSEIRPLLAKGQLVISIAAGMTCNHIEKKLKKKVHVVRAMPNLPVQVGQGITGICPGKAAVNGDLLLARRIFSCVGKAVVVKEKWIDAITAVSGSGPAYVFYFIECMQKAAKSLGLDNQLSNVLVMETIKGSLELLKQQGGSAGDWRAKVTSKGGTTQAALDVFQKRKIDKIFQLALKAAAKRARGLSR